ncbi:uncharacterized protein EV422DRAFT_541094 [Fimicolochytrium jonesii]|uniref:uncharacterized protein n=1 Tax=Fimicolochytrium jonesii TaxID=1396493 RepID=UPI0022FEB1EE|nr:uncharacterized protein EV422DRAFT_541094 [Fimicolochytrium jonesii]KAI8817543.1 hypothetical protein EV422DRAFT_541094 [Fimicolochytrium jonesii]
MSTPLQSRPSVVNSTTTTSTATAATSANPVHLQLLKASDFLVKRGYPPLTDVLVQPGLSPYPAAALSALCVGSAFKALGKGRGWPGYTILLGFGAIFGGSSYILLHDVDNGSSTATAWGVVYTSLFLRSSLASRRVGPIGLLACVMGTTGMYGAEAWDSHFG